MPSQYCRALLRNCPPRSQRREVGFELLDQFLAFYVVRIRQQRLVCQFKALLEFSKLECKEATVEGWLEEVGTKSHRCVEVRLCLLYIALPQLQHTQITVALRMVWVDCHGYLEGLVGKA